jgi:hypothetical protein
MIPDLVITRLLSKREETERNNKKSKVNFNSGIKAVSSTPIYDIENVAQTFEELKNVKFGIVGSDPKNVSKEDTESSTIFEVLTQAISSHDHQLLTKCLNFNVSAVSLTKTVTKLPLFQTLPFLDLLTAMLIKSPGRSNTLIPWIKAILLIHSSYLLTVFFMILI